LLAVIWNYITMHGNMNIKGIMLFFLGGGRDFCFFRLGLHFYLLRPSLQTTFYLKHLSLWAYDIVRASQGKGRDKSLSPVITENLLRLQKREAIKSGTSRTNSEV
jgi:hypothetical protein